MAHERGDRMSAPHDVIDRLAQVGERLTSDRAITWCAAIVAALILVAAVAQALIRAGVI